LRPETTTHWPMLSIAFGRPVLLLVRSLREIPRESVMLRCGADLRRVHLLLCG